VIVRIAAGFAFVLGVTALMGYLHVLGKGPFATLEMRHLREMKERTTAPASYAPVTFEDFAALPHRLSVAEYSAIERRGVSLEGYVQNMLRASDGDIHLEIVPRPDSAGAVQMYVTGEITPGFTRGSPRWRFEALAAELRPDRGTRTPWPGGPRLARFRGWLLFDFQYDDSLGLWTDEPALRMTGWEIHPVTGIELWHDSLARFVEYPR
jgi:hypothetical protein